MGGQIVDATVIQARPARLTADEKAMVRRGEEPEGWTPARKAQIDRDARWTLKRGRKRPPAEGSKRQAVAIAVPVFGYKSHLGIDRAHGLIRTWTVTHAAAHDGGQLGCLLDPANTASGVPPPAPAGGPCRNGSSACCARWADTACRSAANLELLARHVARGNTTRGKVRAAVEHVFAAQKRRFGVLVRTVGIARAKIKIGLANLAYNLTRFAWLQKQAAAA